MSRLFSCLLLGSLVGCSVGSPVQPSTMTVAPSTMSFEAELGAGEGTLMQRAQASGGRTIHLAPGERRRWTFTTGAQEARYALLVTCSNDNDGESEILTATIDDTLIGSLEARDTGDNGVGWEGFVTDRLGGFSLRAGTHTLMLESRGGDGCAEIDLLTVTAGDALLM